MKVGDLVRLKGKHSQIVVGIIVGNAGYKSFLQGGWIVLHSGGKRNVCEWHDLELINESR
tara:strand:- start:13126 stop:13305 length:180 start_codon:yes stop_codon:yes gene_type:complete